MDEIEWWEFDDPREMAEQAAGDMGFVIDSAIEAHGRARVAFPGGKACDLVYDVLAGKGRDWSKTVIMPTDDRLVPPDHDYSNFGKLRRLFGDKGAELIPLVEDAGVDDYREAGRRADARLAALDWPLDLVWLGVGRDGHTASFFPGPDLDRAISGPRERRAVGLRPDPLPEDVPFDRVTLTASALTSARALMIILVGAERRQVLERAIREGPLSPLPIGRLLAEVDAAVDIFWSAD